MASTRAELSRNLSLFDVTMIGVGAMIGAGIFVLTGIAAGAAGPALILAFALNGIVTLFTAMAYAELGSAIPEAGGGYLWVKQGLPGPNAFLSGWMSWFAHAAAGSLYALGFGSYLTLVLADLQIPTGAVHPEVLHKALAVVIILLFLYVNFRGVSETGRAGNIVTVAKVLLLLLFVASGLRVMWGTPLSLEKFTDFAPHGLPGIFAAMGLTFVAFEGYEIIVQAGEEVRDPRTTIPKAVFLSLAIVIPLYVLVAFVAIGAVNPETAEPTYQWLAAHAELGIAEAARQFMPLGTVLLLVGGLLSTMSALNATTYSSTRVSFAMGRDRHLPAAFAAIHRRRRTPYKALAFSGALIILVALAAPLRDVAAATDIMFLLLFLQVNAAAITVRRKYGPRLRYGYLMPFFPVIPLIGIFTLLFLAVFMFNYSRLAWFIALGWIATGALTYYAYARPRAQAESHTPVLLEEKAAIVAEEAPYRVLVPVTDEDSLPVLLRTAVAAARRHQGGLILLRVVYVPDQLPLSAGAAYADDGKAALERALALLEEEDVPVETVLRLSHRWARAIAETAQEKRADLLVMTWVPSADPDAALREAAEGLLDRVGCEVLLLERAGDANFQKLLVPVARVEQLRPALDAALLVAASPQIEVLHVFTRRIAAAEREQFLVDLQEEIATFQAERKIRKGAVTLRTLSAMDPAAAIAKAGQEYDGVVLPARDSWLERRLFGRTVAHVAWKIPKPVILVRPRAGPIGFGLRQVLAFLRGGYKRIDLIAQAKLQELGILRRQPDPDAAAHPVAHRAAVLILAVLGTAGTGAMYLGAGRLWTWIGAAGFVVVLWLFTWIAIHSVESEA